MTLSMSFWKSNDLSYAIVFGSIINAILYSTATKSFFRTCQFILQLLIVIIHLSQRSLLLGIHKTVNAVNKVSRAVHISKTYLVVTFLGSLAEEELCTYLYHKTLQSQVLVYSAWHLECVKSYRKEHNACQLFASKPTMSYLGVSVYAIPRDIIEMQYKMVTSCRNTSYVNEAFSFAFQGNEINILGLQPWDYSTSLHFNH